MKTVNNLRARMTIISMYHFANVLQKSNKYLLNIAMFKLVFLLIGVTLFSHVSQYWSQEITWARNYNASFKLSKT